MTYECAARPTCPACGAEWDDEMLNLLDQSMGFGCMCCSPSPDEIPDVVCHACKRVIYTAIDGPVRFDTHPKS